MNELVQRFLRYVTFNTQSNPNHLACPSSEGQMTFAQFLKQELIELGLSNVSLDSNGYVMAKLPSNVDYPVPAIGFIAHMDTAPDASGENVKAQIVKDYQGGDIALGKGDQIFSPIQYPEIPHGEICIGFTPDEEIGRGADKFDVARFGAEWAYTIDGGLVGAR